MANTLQAFNLLCDTVIEAFDGTAITHFHVGSCVRPNSDFNTIVSEDLVKMLVKK